MILKSLIKLMKKLDFDFFYIILFIKFNISSKKNIFYIIFGNEKLNKISYISNINIYLYR